MTTSAGNYGTRGPRGGEALVLLMAMKVKWPNNVFLLRGHHDCNEMATVYRLKDAWAEMLKGPDTDKLWEKLCTDVFDWLPLAALINAAVFCCHGGIGKQLLGADAFLRVRQMKRPLDVPPAGPITDLLWVSGGCIQYSVYQLQACPTKESGGGASKESKNKEDVKRAMFGTFGPADVDEFMANTGVTLLVRSMQFHTKGHTFYPTARVLSLTSAVNMQQADIQHFINSASMLHINGLADKKVKLQLIVGHTTCAHIMLQSYTLRVKPTDDYLDTDDSASLAEEEDAHKVIDEAAQVPPVDDTQ